MPSLSATPILVDDRQQQPTPEAWAHMLMEEGVETEVSRLPLADFQWVVGDRHVVWVEHKTIRDFLNSVEDGRLGRFVREDPGQFHCLDEDSKWVMVVWNGGDYKLHDRKWYAPHIWMLLLELQTAGIGVFLSKTSGGAARNIATLYRWLAKEEHNSIGGPKLPVPANFYLIESERLRVRLLMSLPGLGEKRARWLLSAYKGDIWGALYACYDDEIRNVEGIGVKTSARVSEFLREAE